MLKHFSADLDKMLYEKLLSLKQTDIVYDYRWRFKLLSTTVDGVIEETLTTLFMNRVTNDLKTKVKMFSPRTLKEMIDKVIQVEAKKWVIDAKIGLWPNTQLHPTFSTQISLHLFSSHIPKIQPIGP